MDSASFRQTVAQFNILACGQEDLSSYFAGAWKQPEPPLFSFETWAGVPRLAGGAGVLACDVHAVHEGGDHWIVIGRVVQVARADSPVVPLVCCGGRDFGIEERTASRVGVGTDRRRGKR